WRAGRSVANATAHFVNLRIETDVEVYRRHTPCLSGNLAQPVGLPGGERQGLLTDGVLAPLERRLGLCRMVVVGRGDVDDVDGRIRKHIVIASIGVAYAELESLF